MRNSDLKFLALFDSGSEASLIFERNWVFATNSNFLIPISLQSDGVNLYYFKLRLSDITEFIVWNIYLRYSTMGYKDIGIRKSEFVAKTQFLSKKFVNNFSILFLYDLIWFLGVSCILGVPNYGCFLQNLK